MRRADRAALIVLGAVALDLLACGTPDRAEQLAKVFSLTMWNDTPGRIENVEIRLEPQGTFSFGALGGHEGEAGFDKMGWQWPTKIHVSFEKRGHQARVFRLEAPIPEPRGRRRIQVHILDAESGFGLKIELLPWRPEEL